MSNATHNALLTSTAAVSAAYAIALLLAPALTLELFDLRADASAVWATRLLGANALGFAAVAFFARNVASIEARRAIDGGFLVGLSVALAVTMWAQYLQVMNALGWINAAVLALFAIGYFYFLAAEDRVAVMGARPT